MSMSGRATAAPLASFPSWRRRLLRPNSTSSGGWAAAGGCLIIAGLVACSAPRRLSVRRDAASKGGACSTGISRRLDLQRTLFIVGRRHKRLPWLPNFRVVAFSCCATIPPLCWGAVFFYSWLCHKLALMLGLGVGLDLVYLGCCSWFATVKSLS